MKKVHFIFGEDLFIQVSAFGYKAYICKVAYLGGGVKYKIAEAIKKYLSIYPHIKRRDLLVNVYDSDLNQYVTYDGKGKRVFFYRR